MIQVQKCDHDKGDWKSTFVMLKKNVKSLLLSESTSRSVKIHLPYKFFYASSQRQVFQRGKAQFCTTPYAQYPFFPVVLFLLFLQSGSLLALHWYFCFLVFLYTLLEWSIYLFGPNNLICLASPSVVYCLSGPSCVGVIPTWTFHTITELFAFWLQLTYSKVIHLKCRYKCLS